MGDLTVTRFGYGAMQLAGPWVLGPPADHDGALAVLRAAVEVGINHIDTSGAYGPRITNELIREALHPYPGSLHIVTKWARTATDPTPRGQQRHHRAGRGSAKHRPDRVRAEHVQPGPPT